MKSTRKKNWHGCPIRFGMGIFGDKWSLLIVRDLMFKGKKHYGEFTDPEEAISTNILADRLLKLEDNGVISKIQDEENLSKYIYRLTDKGIGLVPMMLEMIDWSEKFDSKTEVPKSFIKELRNDRKALCKKIVNGLIKS